MLKVHITLPLSSFDGSVTLSDDLDASATLAFTCNDIHPMKEEAYISHAQLRRMH